MSFGTTDEPVRKLQRLGGTMGLVGLLGMLILAVLVWVLAFTGYETPQAVNKTLLYSGVILAVLGSLCLSAGKSFGRAANDPALLGPALESTNRLFLFCLIMLSLAVLIVGSEMAKFLEKVVSR